MSVARMSLRDQVDMLTNGVRYGEQIIRERNDEIADLKARLAAAEGAGAIDWKLTELHPAPKDRLILATSGWGWRREDEVRESKVIKRTGAVIPASHYKFLKPIGAVVMLYWVDSDLKHLKEGGLWTHAATGAAWFQGFRWWSEANNPLTAEMMLERDPAMLVQNETPDIEAMTPYVPGEAELKQRRINAMLTGGD